MSTSDPGTPDWDEQLEVQMALEEESGVRLPPYPTAEAGLAAMTERLAYLESQYKRLHPDADRRPLVARITRTRQQIADFQQQLQSRN